MTNQALIQNKYIFTKEIYFVLCRYLKGNLKINFSKQGETFLASVYCYTRDRNSLFPLIKGIFLWLAMIQFCFQSKGAMNFHLEGGCLFEGGTGIFLGGQRADNFFQLSNWKNLLRVRGTTVYVRGIFFDWGDQNFSCKGKGRPEFSP